MLAACGQGTPAPPAGGAAPGADAAATAARATVEAAFAATRVPVTSAPTPDLDATVTVIAAAVQTAHAATLTAQPTATSTNTPSPTATPQPSATPDASGTAAALEALVAARVAQGIAATQTAVARLQPTPTPTHTATRTITPVAPQPTVTRRPSGADGARAAAATATPTSTPAPVRPTSTPRPSAAQGPTMLTSARAGRGWDASYATGDKDTFSWETDAPLLPGQVFELAFIPEGAEPEAGRSTLAASPYASVFAPLPGPGVYWWGVWLAQAEPYARLSFLGTGGSLVVREAGWSDAGQSEPEPARPEATRSVPDMPKS